MKVKFPPVARKVYNRFANGCPLDGYAYNDNKLGVRQRFKMVRNRFTASLAASGIAAGEAVALAGKADTSDVALLGAVAVGFAFISKMFHRNMVALQKTNAYKAIEQRVASIYKHS
jgi:hypothetical protein